MATVPDNSFPFSLVGAERDRVRAVGALVQSWRAPLLARHGRQRFLSLPTPRVDQYGMPSCILQPKSCSIAPIKALQMVATLFWLMPAW
jgi:hypothetical protein